MKKITNKAEYLRALENRLRRLPGSDRQKALEYFEEYFAEAGPEREAQAIEDLGSPDAAAEQLIMNLAIKNSEEPVKTLKKGMRGIRIGVLALFAVPIALPSALLMVLLAIMMLLVVLMLLAAFFFSGVMMLFGGIASVIAGFTAFAHSPVQALGAVGLGVTALGFGLILVTGAGCLARFFQKKLIRMFGRMIKRVSNKRAQPAQEGENT